MKENGETFNNPDTSKQQEKAQERKEGKASLLKRKLHAWLDPLLIRIASRPETKVRIEEKKVFDEYVKYLQLTADDLKKKILDVGSQGAYFAKYAKDHKISDNIFSLDIQTPDIFKERSKTVSGKAQGLPFRNETFDLVLSQASVPQFVYFYERDQDTMRKNMSDALLEMLRVIKVGGEVRLGNIFLDDISGILRSGMQDWREALKSVIHDLEQGYGVSIEIIPTDEDIVTLEERNRYEEVYGKPAPKKESVYLIKIKKA